MPDPAASCPSCTAPAVAWTDAVTLPYGGTVKECTCGLLIETIGPPALNCARVYQGERSHCRSCHATITSLSAPALEMSPVHGVDSI